MSIFPFKSDGYEYRVNMHIVWFFCLSYVLSYHMVRQLTSVWYSGVGFRISNLNFTVPWFITRLWNHFEICTEHDNFEIWYTCSSYLCWKSFAIRFSKSLLFIFSWFYVWKFRVNVSFNIVSRRIYSGTLRVETSRSRGGALPPIAIRGCAAL